MAFRDPVMPADEQQPRERKDWADYLSAGLQIAGGVGGAYLGAPLGPAGAVAGAQLGAGAGQALSGLFNPYADSGPQQVAGGVNTALAGGASYASADAARRKAQLEEQARNQAAAYRQGAGGQVAGYGQPTPSLSQQPVYGNPMQKRGF